MPAERETDMEKNRLRQIMNANPDGKLRDMVAELLYDDRLTGLRLRNTLTGEEREIFCDGVFISVGRKPATALVRGQLALDESGYIPAGETTGTEIPGVYAAGDVRGKPLRQVVTAVADGALAVQAALDYLSGIKKSDSAPG